MIQVPAADTHNCMQSHWGFVCNRPRTHARTKGYPHEAEPSRARECSTARGMHFCDCYQTRETVARQNGSRSGTYRSATLCVLWISLSLSLFYYFLSFSLSLSFPLCLLLFLLYLFLLFVPREISRQGDRTRWICRVRFSFFLAFPLFFEDSRFTSGSQSH